MKYISCQYLCKYYIALGLYNIISVCERIGGRALGTKPMISI